MKGLNLVLVVALAFLFAGCSQSNCNQISETVSDHMYVYQEGLMYGQPVSSECKFLKRKLKHKVNYSNCSEGEKIAAKALLKTLNCKEPEIGETFRTLQADRY